MHADPDIDGVPDVDFPGVDMPGVDIPGMEGADGEAVNYGATGEIPGVPDPSDNDSDNDEHNPIRTRSGRTVHSTQNSDYV